MVNVHIVRVLAILSVFSIKLSHQQRKSMECGVPKMNINEVILRGRDTKPGRWPWHAAIYHRSDGRTLAEVYACGGTVISADFIVTAGHCVEDSNGYVLSKRRMVIKLGIHDIIAPDSRGLQTHRVLEIHSYVDSAAQNNNKNDIALIELSTAARFTNYVQPVCINTERDLTGQVGTVPGWGYTEFDDVSATLKIVELPVIDSRKCLQSDRETFGSTLDISLFCAGYLNGTGVCNGDSGGGLVVKRDGRYYLGGIVSYTAERNDSSNLCTTHGYAGFTNVYHFIPWIKNVTGLPLSVTEQKRDQNNLTNDQCTTPDGQGGSCVAVQRCKNIWNILKSPTPMTQFYPYIKQAECTLPGVKRSVCCQLSEISEESLTTSTEAPSTTMKLPTDCGRVLRNRIAGGSLTKVFEYPWMAALMYTQKGITKYVQACVGSLINKRYVMTAAHCISERDNIQLNFVRLGEHNSKQEVDCNIYRNNEGEEIERDCAGPVEDYAVESIVVHSNYNSPRHSNDIGLVHLAKEVTYKDHIQPICLPVTSELQSRLFKQYIITGWGSTESESNVRSDILLKVELPYVANNACQQRLTELNTPIQLSDTQMCAGGVPSQSTCKGDGGGPLGASTNYNGVRFIQFGIMSAGDSSCGRVRNPDIFTRVANFMDWILENIDG